MFLSCCQARLPKAVITPPKQFGDIAHQASIVALHVHVLCCLISVAACQPCFCPSSSDLGQALLHILDQARHSRCVPVMLYSSLQSKLIKEGGSRQNISE
jgi:hypothetical protein